MLSPGGSSFTHTNEKGASELQHVLKRIRISGILFLSVLVGGSIGYALIEDGVSWFDAFYMTAITVSTIGFHEVIDLEGHLWGRLFTILIAFSGIGLITYLFSNVAALFVEGDLRKTFRSSQMEKKISKMQGHYIICGSGRVGTNIAHELIKTERPFVLSDMMEDKLEKALKELGDIPHLVGDNTDDGTLERLGLNRSKGVFVTTGDDNINLVICLTCRQLNPGIRIVALSRDIHHVRKMMKAGADKVIAPYHQGGQRMASEMIRPEVTRFLDEMMRSDFNQRFEEFTINAQWSGKTLGDINLDSLKETIVIAINHNGEWTYKPTNTHKLVVGSHLVLMTTPKDRIEVEKRF